MSLVSPLSSDIAVRAASSIIFVAILLGSLWVDGWLFFFLWLAISIGILWEWQRLIQTSHLPLRLFFGSFFLIGIAYACLPFPLQLYLLPEKTYLLLPTCWVMGPLSMAMLADKGKRMWAAGGFLYAALLLLSVLHLFYRYGEFFLLLAFLNVWTTDTMAYVGGRLIGGPKLCPLISPHKTWAGFASGLFFATCLGAGIAWGFSYPPLAFAILFLLLATVSQAGDLYESYVKRYFQVKDSSTLIPGHGGLMDRLDAFLFAAALLVWILENRFFPF